MGMLVSEDVFDDEDDDDDDVGRRVLNRQMGLLEQFTSL